VQLPNRRVRRDWSLSRGLVERILSDVAREAGSLPLLEFALTELWNGRQGALLTHGTYDGLGQVAGAIATRAEAAFEEFTPERQKVVRRVFTRLVRVARPEEGGDDTRCRAALNEFDHEGQGVVRALAAADTRLLVTGRDESTGEQTVEVAHETLIRRWDRFRDWVNEDREFLLWRQRLRAVMADWVRAQGSHDALLSKAGLAEAGGWVERRAADLSEDEQAFIGNSAKKQRVEEQRWKELYEQAEQQRQVGTARRLAAQSELLRDQQPALLELSVVLAVESVRRFPLLENDQALRRGLALLPKGVTTLAHQGRVLSVAFSPDGRYLATGGEESPSASQSADSRAGSMTPLFDEQPIQRSHQVTKGPPVARITGAVELSSYVANVLAGGSPENLDAGGRVCPGMVRVFAMASGQEVARLSHKGSVFAVAFSPDGRYLATGSGEKASMETTHGTLMHPIPLSSTDPNFPGAARVFDLTAGKEVAQLYDQGWVARVAWSTDGCYVAIPGHVFELATGRRAPRLSQEAGVDVRAWSPDGRHLLSVSADNRARVLRAVGGQEVARLPRPSLVDFFIAAYHRIGSSKSRRPRNAPMPIAAVAFSPDGRYAVTGSSDQTARVFDVTSGKEVSRLTHQGRVHAVAFSPDGRRVATGSSDQTARVFEAASGTEVARFIHQDQDGVGWVSFSPDGRYLGTRSGRTARLFEVANGKEVGRFSHESRITASDFSPDGRRMVTGSEDKTVRVLEFASSINVPRIHQERTIHAIAFSPDGRHVAVGGVDPVARILEIENGREIAQLSHRGEAFIAIAFSPGGRYLATAKTYSPSVLVFDALTGKEVAQLSKYGPFGRVAFSPDERLVAMGNGFRRTACVCEVATGNEVTHVTLENNGPAVAFSPDGRRLATSAGMVDIMSGEQMSRFNHQAVVNSVAFGPDGRYVATASHDKAARLYEVVSGEEVARLTQQGPFRHVAFSPDGRYLAAGSDNSVGLLNVEKKEEVARLTHDGPVLALRFSADGRYLVTGSHARLGGVSTRFSLNEIIISRHVLHPEDLIAEACSRLTRNLTREDWQQYFPGEPYSKTCPDLP
jgi:WD40 repeat protein